MGWTRERILDLGGIQASRGVEMYLPLLPSLYSRHGSPILNIKVVHGDKAESDKLEAHREEVSSAMERREADLKRETHELKTLLQSNTEITQQDKGSRRSRR